jgi:hypothetical protein
MSFIYCQLNFHANLLVSYIISALITCNFIIKNYVNRKITLYIYLLIFTQLLWLHVQHFIALSNEKGKCLPPRWPPQCSCVVIESSFDPGERLQAPGSLWFLFWPLCCRTFPCFSRSLIDRSMCWPLITCNFIIKNYVNRKITLYIYLLIFTQLLWLHVKHFIAPSNEKGKCEKNLLV